MANLAPQIKTLTKKDFLSNQEVRWCPGCGDYSILSQVQKIFSTLGVPKENFAIFSGIGCSSRFPYYMDTYGFHGVHGRAAAMASGAKIANPDLSVWVVSGDGDSMAIGGNHFIHLLRRNLDINLLLFNNRIYGLTKGQYSPTSEQGKKTKSSPMGSLDYPFNPPQLALGSGGTFIARGIDQDPKHMQELLTKAYKHNGTSFVEIYQNCIIFNDGAFSKLVNKDTKADTVLRLERDKPMLFGQKKEKGLRLVGAKLKVGTIGIDCKLEDILIHDEHSKTQGLLLSELTYDGNFPTPIGVIYHNDQPTYEELVVDQINGAIDKFGKGNIDKLFTDGHTWEVK